MTTEEVRIARDNLRAQLGREPLLRELVDRVGGSRRTVRRYLGKLHADVRGVVSGVDTPPSQPAPAPPVEANGLLFGELVTQMQTMLPQVEWDLAALADRLTQQGIPPALGAQAWDKQVVDRCLVYAASHQRALAQEPQRG